MKKIISIFGARPQFIKVEPICTELKKKRVEHILVHTGQHYDYKMSKLFFNQLNLPEPDYNLGVGSHFQGKQTGLMLEKIENILLKEKPDIVIVYGDTNSTLAGALAAAKLDIPVAHVEAGLRSYRMDMPEEINRVLTDRVSKLLFCPTKTALDNLKKEGIIRGGYLVGDVMYDIFLKSQRLSAKSKILSYLNLKPKGYLLLTIHRQENTDNPNNLKSIIYALGRVKQKVVFPIHPRTKKFLKINNIKLDKNFLVTDPVGYFDMLALGKHASKIITDSGGLQKEAYWLKVPCITLRRETEWSETVENGWNILTGANEEKIVNAIRGFTPKDLHRKYFNNGAGAKRIVKILIKNIKRE